MTLAKRLVIFYCVTLVISACSVLFIPNLLEVLGILAWAFVFLGLGLWGLWKRIHTSTRSFSVALRSLEGENSSGGIATWRLSAITDLDVALQTTADTVNRLRKSHDEHFLRTQAATTAAINAFPHAVAILTPEAKIELVNHAAERFFGWKPGDEIQNSPQAWLEPLVSRALETGQSADPKPGEPPVQVFDNARELFFRPRTIPASDPAGKVVGVTVVLVDATQLRQIDEAKSGLVSTVSHELKTPLTSIQMALHLLLDDAPPALSPRQLELLKTACSDADRLHELIQNLLDAGRRGTPSA